MKKHYIVGMTGPTGAGKSSLSSAFEKAGFFTIDCDKAARIVTKPNGAAIPGLCREFGEDILKSDGTLDRARLAERAFATPAATARLNKITLPLIILEIKKLIENCDKKNILLDAPTLFESGADKFCDTILAVLADVSLRKERIMQRDKLSEQAAQRRINAGKTDKFYLENCRHILYNNGDEAKLLAEVDALIQKIIKESC